MNDKANEKPDVASSPGGAVASGEPAPPLRRYEKPVLRRYDQIEQVRPYGPSEI